MNLNWRKSARSRRKLRIRNWILISVRRSGRMCGCAEARRNRRREEIMSANSAPPRHLRPPKLGPRLQRAFRYAAEQHDGQTRKQSAVPYLSHLMAVASLVLEAGGDEDMAVAALLHDVVEDCGGMPRLREIRKQFGPRVAKIVEGCTDSFGEPKPEWVERKKDYLREVQHAGAETRLVSASDKLHNVRTILA